jgi:hypothetical protein
VKLGHFHLREEHNAEGVGGEEVTGELRKLHNEELHDFYPSPDTVWVIKKG